MPVYTCPRCGGPITPDGAGMLQCPTAPCQYGHDDPRTLMPQLDVVPSLPSKIGIFKAGYENLFDLFWDEYPRKTAKAVAKKSWMKLKPDIELFEKMIAALAWQKQSKQWADDSIIPHPATWLNQRRWEDEPPEALAPSGPPKPPPMSFREQAHQRSQQLRRQGIAPTQPPRPIASRLPQPALPMGGDDRE